MKKRHFLFPFIAMLLLPAAILWGQQAMELQVVGSAGTVLAGSSGTTLHFTVGEMMVAEAQNNNILPQGFHQIVVWQIVPSDEPADISFQVKVYPNPTSGYLQVETEMPLQVSMYDLNGRMVLPVSDITSMESFDLTGFASGMYFLRVMEKENSVVKSFKVQVIK